MDRNTQKRPETDRKGQNKTETDQSGQKQTEKDKNRQKRTETDRNLHVFGGLTSLRSWLARSHSSFESS